MKKYGSTNANASVAKNTVEEDVEHALLRVLVQIATTFLRVFDRRLRRALELDVRLDELDRAVGTGRHGLHRRAGEPVDHRAAGDQAEQERRVQERQVREVFRLQAVRERRR